MLTLGRLIASDCISNLPSHEASQLLEMESDLKLMRDWERFSKPHTSNKVHGDGRIIHVLIGKRLIKTVYHQE